MDDRDRQLLILFQKEIPLKPRPFEVMGKTIGIDSADVMLRFNRLQEDQAIGSFRAVFDAEKMGYRSYLIVLQVASEQIDQAIYYVTGHPGVTQCIRRQGDFNFWFYLTLSPSESVEFHSQRLKDLSGAQKLLILRIAKSYKPVVKKNGEAVSGEEFTVLEQRLIRLLQEDFPLADDPFRKIAKELGTTEELVLKQLQLFQKNGILKKIIASPVVKEKRSLNALVLWNIPEEKIEEAGEQIAAFPYVSGCVKRTVYQELPYNLHVQIESMTEQGISERVESMERHIGMWPRQCLLKEKEEKRGRIKYFSHEIEDWRLQHEDPSFSSISPSI